MSVLAKAFIGLWVWIWIGSITSLYWEYRFGSKDKSSSSYYIYFDIAFWPVVWYTWVRVVLLRPKEEK